MIFRVIVGKEVLNLVSVGYTLLNLAELVRVNSRDSKAFEVRFGIYQG